MDKFLHVAYHIHQELFRDRFMIGGFYNWHLAFKGDFKLYGPEVEKSLPNYDIVFVGISRPELEGVILSRMRRALGPKSKTKIVACIDYAIELWMDTFNPWQIQQELLSADMVFSAEPMMKTWIQTCVENKIPVFHIPHPTNVEAINAIAKPVEDRDNEAVAIIHRYDNYWYPMHLIAKNIPCRTTALMLDPSIEQRIFPYFSFTKHGFRFTEYLEWISHKKVAFDSYHRMHTYGRTATDNACLKLPTVGSDMVWCQQYLWPDLTVKSGDLTTAVDNVKKLLSNKEFYLDCVEKARENVELFSYEERKKDFMNKLYN